MKQEAGVYRGTGELSNPAEKGLAAFAQETILYSALEDALNQLVSEQATLHSILEHEVWQAVWEIAAQGR